MHIIAIAQQPTAHTATTHGLYWYHPQPALIADMQDLGRIPSNVKESFEKAHFWCWGRQTDSLAFALKTFKTTKAH